MPDIPSNLRQWLSVNPPPYLRKFYNYIENVAVRHRLVVLFFRGGLRGSFVDQFRILSMRRFLDFAGDFYLGRF